MAGNILRAKANSKIPSAIFKVPQRIVSVERKRDGWISDLASNVPLESLVKTVPHGYRGEKLLDVLLNKQIPLHRALWFVKVVGLGEIGSKKDRVSFYTLEWTKTLLGLVEKTLLELDGLILFENGKRTETVLHEKDWQSETVRNQFVAKWYYLVRLVRAHYDQDLLEHRSFLTTLFESFKAASLSKTSFLLILIQTFLDQYLLSRRLSRCIVSTCFDKLAQLSVVSSLSKCLKDLVHSFGSDGDILVSPQLFPNLDVYSITLSNSKSLSTRYWRLRQPRADSIQFSNMLKGLERVQLHADIGPLYQEWIVSTPSLIPISQLARFFEWSFSSLHPHKRFVLPQILASKAQASGWMKSLEDVLLLLLKSDTSMHFLTRLYFELDRVGLFSFNHFLHRIIGTWTNTFEKESIISFLVDFPVSIDQSRLLRERQILLDLDGYVDTDSIDSLKRIISEKLKTMSHSLQDTPLDIPQSCFWKARLSTWLLHHVQSLDQRMSLNNRQVCFVVDTIEKLSDYDSLLEFILLILAKSGNSILETIIRTIQRNQLVFECMGSAPTIFNALMARIQSITIPLSPDLFLVRYAQSLSMIPLYEAPVNTDVLFESILKRYPQPYQTSAIISLTRDDLSNLPESHEDILKEVQSILNANSNHQELVIKSFVYILEHLHASPLRVMAFVEYFSHLVLCVKNGSDLLKQYLMTCLSDSTHILLRSSDSTVLFLVEIMARHCIDVPILIKEIILPLVVQGNSPKLLILGHFLKAIFYFIGTVPLWTPTTQTRLNIRTIQEYHLKSDDSLTLLCDLVFQLAHLRVTLISLKDRDDIVKSLDMFLTILDTGWFKDILLDSPGICHDYFMKSEMSALDVSVSFRLLSHSSLEISNNPTLNLDQMRQVNKVLLDSHDSLIHGPRSDVLYGLLIHSCALNDVQISSSDLCDLWWTYYIQKTSWNMSMNLDRLLSRLPLSFTLELVKSLTLIVERLNIVLETSSLDDIAGQIWVSDHIGVFGLAVDSILCFARDSKDPLIESELKFLLNTALYSLDWFTTHSAEIETMKHTQMSWKQVQNGESECDDRIGWNHFKTSLLFRVQLIRSLAPVVIDRIQASLDLQVIQHLFGMLSHPLVHCFGESNDFFDFVYDLTGWFMDHIPRQATIELSDWLREQDTNIPKEFQARVAKILPFRVTPKALDELVSFQVESNTASANSSTIVSPLLPQGALTSTTQINDSQALANTPSSIDPRTNVPASDYYRPWEWLEEWGGSNGFTTMPIPLSNFGALRLNYTTPHPLKSAWEQGWRPPTETLWNKPLFDTMDFEYTPVDLFESEFMDAHLTNDDDRPTKRIRIE